MITPTKAAPPRVSTTVERAIRRPALPELGGGQGKAAHEPEVPDERPEHPVLDEPWRARGAWMIQDNRDCLAALPRFTWSGRLQRG